MPEIFLFGKPRIKVVPQSNGDVIVVFDCVNHRMHMVGLKLDKERQPEFEKAVRDTIDNPPRAVFFPMIRDTPPGAPSPGIMMRPFDGGTVKWEMGCVMRPEETITPEIIFTREGLLKLASEINAKGGLVRLVLPTILQFGGAPMTSRKLTPLSKEGITPSPFLTYDFEWHIETPESLRDGSAYRIRVGSFFDGQKHRSFSYPDYNDPRTHKSDDPIGALLDALLVPKYSGFRFYAHWGGIADTLYLFQAIHDRQLATKIVVNGSAAAIVIVTACSDLCKFQCHHRKHKWTFVDSSFLFRFGLAKLGKLIGLAKGGDEGTSWNTTDDVKLTDYNNRDNEVLFEAISRMQKIANGMHAKLGMTMAATSLDLFRRAYLKREIVTPDKENDFAKRAYYASRVEPYRYKMARGFAYDVNSSFVYSMTFPLPGSPVSATRGHLPTNGELYIAEVTVDVPDMFLPPLPYRGSDGRLFFPTGRWRGIYTSVDIDLAREVGVKISDVGRVVTYEERTDLRDFAQDVYNKRTEAGDKFLYTAIKLLGNGAYGKFGEGEEKSEYLMHPASTLCETHYCLWKGRVICVAHAKEGCADCNMACECMSMVSPGIWRYDNKREIQHRHTQIGAFITSIARRTLYQGQYSYQDHLHYSDTDCVHLSCMMTPENKTGHLTHTDSNSGILGGFKLEGERSEMIYIAPKIYGGKDGNGDPLLAMKGFRLGSKVFNPEKGREVFPQSSVDRFIDIVNGKPVYDVHMVRPKEYLAKMHLRDKPYDVKVGIDGKRLVLGQRPKRARDGENITRPWTVAELESEKDDE